MKIQGFGVSTMIKLLSFFFSVEQIFYIVVAKDSKEAFFVTKEKYFDHFDYKQVKIPLVRFILRDEEAVLYKEDNTLIYEKKNVKIVYPFVLKSLELNNVFILKNDQKELIFFLNNPGYRVIYHKPEKNKKDIFFVHYDQNPQRCLELDDNCNVIKNTCYQCTYGSEPIYTAKCEKNFDRICGPTLCGEYNNYACLRGYQYKNDIRSGCQTGSEEVFCKKSLKAFCRDNTLICL